MLWLVTAAVIAPPEMVVVADQGKSKWVIVAGDNQPTTKRGVQELQKYIQQSTGAKLALVEKPGKGPYISVAFEGRLRAEEYSITASKDRIAIRGGLPRGVMYGCYGFLQDWMGIRWLTSSITTVPMHKRLAFPIRTDRQKPAFEYREPYYTEAFEKEWGLHNRVNGNIMPFDESVGGKVSYGRFVHTFSELVPPETYFKTHPEYFSMVDGQRRDGYAQLCLTNPDVVKIATEKVRQWIKENPTATIFSVSQNDTYLNCQCPNCKAVEVREISPSGPLLQFVNQVAQTIGKEFPNVLIDTLAYQWSEKPPAHLKPLPNVRVRLAPINACFSHPLFGCEKNKVPYENLKEWSKVTHQLYIWHYCTNFHNYLQPLPDLDEIRADVKLFRDLGVVGLFYEGAYGPGGGAEMAELKSYLLARLMWNPDLDTKVLMNEFLTGVYGPALKEIQAWLDLVHKPEREQKIDAWIYDPPTAAYFPAALLEEGSALFDKAEAKCQRDPRALDQVQKARLALEYVQFQQMPPTDPNKAKLADILATKIRKYKIGETSEGGSSENFLKAIGKGE